METFLNENSLHQQFTTITDFSSALVQLNGVLFDIAGLGIDKRLYYDPGTLYLRRTIRDQVFGSCLAHISDKSARVLFKTLLMDRLSAQNWREDQKQEDVEYRLNGEDFRGTTLAECAERRLNASIGFLLNFRSMLYPPVGAITVAKQANEEIVVACVSDRDGLLYWFRANPQLGILTYDINSPHPPKDEETVLGRRSRFQKTRLVNQGRSVYLDRQTYNYWSMDNNHFGLAAHIEVFDAQGRHVGEASLEGILDERRRDPEKSLEL